MDNQTLIWSLQQLCPGVAWNVSGGVATQAIDGTPRVAMPTQDAINAMAATYVAPPAPVSLQDQVVTLQAQVAQLLAGK